MTTLLLRSALRPLALLKPTLQRHSAVQLQSHFNVRQALHTSAVRFNLESAETQSHPLVATVKGVSASPTQRPVQIYIGNLGPEIDSERLKLELVHYQGVGEVNVVMNPETGVSRGFAFVDFASIEAAQFVIDDAHGRELNGQALVVAPSKQSMPTRAEEKLSGRALPARRLHIVNLPRELSELAIREVFTQHGGEIERVQRLLARKTQLPNGVAFITFKTQESATYALEALHNTQIGDRVVQVNYAQSINGKPVTAARVKLEREREEAKARPRGGDAEDGLGFNRRSASRRSEGGERSEYASRERSDYGDRERRSSFSDREPRSNYGDRESRSNYGDRSSGRETRSFGGEREQRNSYERESRPTRAPREREEFAPRRGGGRDDFDAFEEPMHTRQSSFGERASREPDERGARSFGGREARSYGGERESRGFGGDRESRSYGGGRESPSYGDREESSFGGRPRSSSSGGYGGGERSSFGASRDGERSSFGGSRGGDRGGYGGGAGRSSGGERSNFGRGGARGGRGGFGRDRGSSGSESSLRDKWA